MYLKNIYNLFNRSFCYFIANLSTLLKKKVIMLIMSMLVQYDISINYENYVRDLGIQTTNYNKFM